MIKQFEEQFNNLQADMVAICLEYCKGHCDEVYIHIIHENDSTFVNFFFRVDGLMYLKSKLPEGEVDASRQSAALDIVLKNARKIITLLEESNSPVPTEFRIKYDRKTGNFEADYHYAPVKGETKTDRQITLDWFNSLQ